MADDEEDALSPLPNISNSNKQHDVSYSPSNTHVKTYTAGEDHGRLAEMAKEFGLAKHREPKRQVRAPPPLHRRRSSTSEIKQRMMSIIFDHGLEDARMQAIYTSHNDENGLREQDEGGDDTYESWAHEMFAKYDEMIPEEEGENGDNIDPHAHGIGGDLTSAVLGIIKSMVGPAILYLPHGFATAGYGVALPIMFAATCLYLYSSTCLIDSWRIESKEFDNDDDDTDTDNNIILTEEEDDKEYEPLNPTKKKKEASTADSTYGSSSSNGTTKSGDIEMTNVPHQKQPKKRHRRILLSYPELAYRALGPMGESIVKTGIALMQSGVCLTYLIFVPQNLHTSMNYLFGLSYISPSHWLLVMIGIQIPLSWIRDIRKFTITNLLANCFILYGLSICISFAVKEASKTPIHNTSDNTIIDEPMDAIWYRFINLNPYVSNWFLFVGTSILLFEGSITLMVPLQEAVQGHERRKAFPQVFRRVIICIITFYAFFAIICWMGFGNDVRTVLTVSLPSGILSSSVQVAYSIAVIFTFPLQNFPSLEISCHSISSFVKKSIINNNNNSNDSSGRPSSIRSSSYSSSASNHSNNNTTTPWYISRNFISSLIVCMLSVVAVLTMDSLDKVVSLMGSMLGCPIAFVFPPLIHNVIHSKNISSIRKVGNYVVSFLGLCCMILASIITIIQW